MPAQTLLLVAADLTLSHTQTQPRSRRPRRRRRRNGGVRGWLRRGREGRASAYEPKCFCFRCRFHCSHLAICVVPAKFGARENVDFYYTVIFMSDFGFVRLIKTFKKLKYTVDFCTSGCFTQFIWNGRDFKFVEGLFLNGSLCPWHIYASRIHCCMMNQYFE